VARFKENTIACTELHHITCINTKPNTKRAAIELDERVVLPAPVTTTNERISGDESKKRWGKSRLEFVHGGWSTILRPGI